jgi:hypothetical protein
VRQKKAEELARLREERKRLLLLGGGIGLFVLGFILFAILTEAPPLPLRRRVNVMLGALAFTLGVNGVLWLIHWLQCLERRPSWEEERREAQYNRFLELLRDVKGRLRNRSGA